MIRRYSILGLIIAGALLLFLAACSGGGGTTLTKTTAPATINVSLSDPAPCSASASTGGTYQSVFIAITDVQINASGSAGDNDPNWLDLTPSLKSSGVPMQVDLLALPNPQCFLATLGSTTAIPPGTYQQIRIILADNTAANANLLGNNNGCKAVAAAVNCVILPTTPPTTAVLQLSSEAKTGLKIPSGQIAGGQFTIASGETKDLDIDINACGSVVQVVAQGNTQFRLKPVLHAGEVSLTSSSINGTLVGADLKPLTGVKAIVVLETRNTGSSTDSFFMETTVDSSGHFNFCPVPAGTYDVVAAVVSSTINPAFAATITTGASPGTNLGNVVMNTVTGSAAATLHGDVTTASSSTGGIEEHVVLSALQQVTIGSNTITFIIPANEVTPSTKRTVVTAANCGSATCPSFSATYDLVVPPANPTTGAFVAGTTTQYTAAPSGNPNYVVQGDAFKSVAGDNPCSPTSTLSSSTVSVTPGVNPTPVPTLAFVGCQ